MPFAELGEVSLFYTDAGAGDPPILFVHGYSCDSHDWSWQLPHFASTHRVIAVDLRGHGRSSVPEDGYDPSQYAADLAALLERQSVAPVVAIGHSLGGAIVSALAVEHAEMVRAVVVVDPAYLLREERAGAVAATMEAAGRTRSPARRTPTRPSSRTGPHQLYGLGICVASRECRPRSSRRHSREPWMALVHSPMRASPNRSFAADSARCSLSMQILPVRR